MNSSKLHAILAILIEAGHDVDIHAEHDQLFLAPPGKIDPDSELGQKLKAAGALYDDGGDGWYIFT